VRLAVMNLLAPRLGGCRWLDLCCGSGVMACEALQRGAAAVVGVERDRRVAAVALANLELVAASLGAPAAVTVHRREVVQWLGSENPSPFDVIYCDPPYRAGLHGAVAEAVMRAGWLAPEGVLVWECGSDALPSVPEGWNLRDQRRYGGTTLLLLQAPPAEPGACGAQVEEMPRVQTSAAEGAAAAVLVPGGHEQAHQRHGDQTEHDATEQGFDHGPIATERRCTILPRPRWGL
jgi:16S rRNA (guanine(966)-N(2))-methyltransferase RsmD